MSTGGRVFPSVTGGGLARGAEAFVTGRARRRAEALQERQLSNSERITDLNAFTRLVPFLEIGTTLGDTDQATQNLFSRAFAVDAAEFQTLDLNKETIDSLVERVILDGFADITPEDARRTEVVRANQGLEPIIEVANLNRDRATMGIEGLRRIRNDPFRYDDFIARLEGLDPITIEFPDGRGPQTFDRVEAATLYVSMLRDQDVATARFGTLATERRAEIIDQIRDAVRQREFEVGAPAVSRILDIYDQAIEARDGSIIDAFLASGATQGEKLAMEVVRGSMAFGDEFLFEGFPPEMRRLMQVAAVVEAIQDADPEAVQDLVDQLPEALFGSFKEGPFGFGRPEFQLTELDPTGVTRAIGGGAGTIDPATVSQEVQIQGVMDVLGQELPEGQTAGQRRAIMVGQVGIENVVAGETRFAEAAVEITEETVTDQPTRSVEQQRIVDSQRRQITSLQRMLDTSTEPRVQRTLGRRIARLEAELAIDQTVLPIEREGTDEIPAGGIDPANVPASLRARVLQLNTLIRRRDNLVEGSPRLRQTFDPLIERALTTLRRLLAEG